MNRRALILTAAASLLLAAGLASDLGFAQTQTGYGNPAGQTAAADLYATQKDGLKGTFTQANQANVPGSGADSGHLQSYYSNPTAMVSDGAAAAGPSPYMALVTAAGANAASATISSTDSWLQQSNKIAANPQSQIGTSGSSGQTCTTTTTTTQVQNAPRTYSCLSAASVSDTSASCTQTLQVNTSTRYASTCTSSLNVQTSTNWPSTCTQNLIVDPGTTTYTYTCTSTWDQASSQWALTGACKALAASPACTPSGGSTIASSGTCTLAAYDSGKIAIDPQNHPAGYNYFYFANIFLFRVQTPQTNNANSNAVLGAATKNNCIVGVGGGTVSNGCNHKNGCYLGVSAIWCVKPFTSSLPAGFVITTHSNTTSGGKPSSASLDATVSWGDPNTQTSGTAGSVVLEANTAPTPCRFLNPTCTGSSAGTETMTYTCTVPSHNYTCSADVPAADPAVSQTSTVAGTHWDVTCGQASDPACTAGVTTCTDAGSTHTVNGLAVTEPCWSQTTHFVCQNPTYGGAANTQVTGTSWSGTCGQATDPSCQAQGSATCTDANSTHTVNGRGGGALAVTAACWSQTSNYTCSSNTYGGTANTTVTGTSWSGSCPQASDPTCQAQGSATCTDANSTHTVNGLAVTEPCWRKTTAYQCETTGAAKSNCNVPAGCSLDRQECLDNPPPTNGTCSSVNKIYSCASTSTKTTTQSNCSANMCLGSQCFAVSGSHDSGNLGKAYAALSAAHQAGQSYAGNQATVTVFPGKGLACREDVAGLSDCCSDSGWGNRLGVTSCSGDEKSLAQQQAAGQCHYVGSWCSESSLFGVCLQTSMRYCCFSGMLARIIQEAGHDQLHKGWGTATQPDCTGFTVAQFQMLDLSKVDFSEFYNQALAGLTAPDKGGALSSIQSTLQSMGASPPANTPAFTQ